MILHINTNDGGGIKVALKQGSMVMAEKKVKAERREAEKLLPAVEALLKSKKINLSQIKKIEVANSGGSFTSLRIGVVTANALAYALRISAAGESGKAKKVKIGRRSFSVVEPLYDREPEITIKKPATDSA